MRGKYDFRDGSLLLTSFYYVICLYIRIDYIARDDSRIDSLINLIIGCKNTEKNLVMSL